MLFTSQLLSHMFCVKVMNHAQIQCLAICYLIYISFVSRYVTYIKFSFNTEHDLTRIGPNERKKILELLPISEYLTDFYYFLSVLIVHISCF